MPVTSYIDNENGQVLYMARVRRTSATQKGIKIDRKLKGFESKIEAERADRKLFAIVERELMRAEQQSCLWQTLVDEWEVAAKNGDIFLRQLGPQTINDYSYIIREHCKDWMTLHVSEIDRAMAWRVLDRIERELSIARRKRLRTVIDAVFNWGILSGRIRDIKTVPTDGFKGLNKEDEKLPEILNLEQIRTLLEYAQTINHDWYAHWALALFTGMRSGELYALEWDQVDFDNKIIYVHRNWTNRTGYGPTKGRYWRAVPIESSQVINLLKELKAQRAGEKFVLRHFKLWTDGEQARVLREFCVGAGLPSVKFHTLRACFATQLIKDAIAPGVVMKICGWKDLKTMQRYIRLAGIEVKGATQGLKLLPERQVMGRVVELFRTDS